MFKFEKLNVKIASSLDLDADVQPNWDSDDVPRCSEDKCPNYDGKRCRAMGQRPDGICEPAVIAMGAKLREWRWEE